MTHLKMHKEIAVDQLTHWASPLHWNWPWILSIALKTIHPSRDFRVRFTFFLQFVLKKTKLFSEFVVSPFLSVYSYQCFMQTFLFQDSLDAGRIRRVLENRRREVVDRQVLYCIVLYCILLYCIVLYCIVLQQQQKQLNYLSKSNL